VQATSVPDSGRTMWYVPVVLLSLTVLMAGGSVPATRARAEAMPEVFATLTPNQGGATAGFGLDLAADGEYAVIGAAGENAARGAAYVYRFNPDRSVTRLARLQASDGVAADRFGSAVAIDGSTIVVGAYGANADAGAAYVFKRPDAGWSGELTQTAKLTAANSAYLGYSVAVSSGAVVAGDYGHDGARGAVRVYDTPLLGWQDDATPTKTMLASDADPSDQLGRAVAISGDTVVAGAKDNNGRGAAYVFERGVGLFGPWPASQTAKLTTSTGEVGDDVGDSVDVDESTIVVGAPQWGSDGAAFVYSRPAGGWQDATQTARLTVPSDPGSSFAGVAVIVNGSEILVGATGIGQRGGLVKFTEADAGWTTTDESAWQIAPTGNTLDQIGSSVAANDDYVLLGWPSAQLAAGGGGAVLLYGFPNFASAPLRLSFPETQVASTADAKTVTVSNSGSAVLLPSVELTGEAPGDFAIVSDTCTAAAWPAGSCTVSVTFTPTAANGRNAFLQFTDGADASPQRIPLTGTGTPAAEAAPTASPTQDPAPASSMTPTPESGVSPAPESSSDPAPQPGPNAGARPAPPKGLKVVPKRKKVKATWRAGARANEYRIAVRGKKPKVVRTATTAALHRTVKSLKPSKRYRVCVRSHNDAGSSKKVCRRTRTKG